MHTTDKNWYSICDGAGPLDGFVIGEVVKQTDSMTIQSLVSPVSTSN